MRLLALAVALAPAASLGAPPTVGVRTEASVGSWQLLSAPDLAKLVEAAVLEALSKGGALSLVRLAKDGPSPDYRLDVSARIAEETARATVTVAIGPGARDDLPSFLASESVPLDTKDRALLVRRIEAASRGAGERLSASIAPFVTVQAPDPRAHVESLPFDRPLPFRWPEVEAPRPRATGEHDLFASSEAKRGAALRVHAAAVRAGDATATRALEACLLGHPDARLRAECLSALIPAARRSEGPRAAILAAFRKDPDREVRKRASEEMEYFTGEARGLAIQAWLESASKGEVLGPLAALGDLPNLDATIHRCLLAAGRRPKHQRSKRACIELLPPLSHARRLAILRPFLFETNVDSPFYLEGAGPREGSTGTDWQWAVEAALERATAWLPELEEALWARYQRDLSSTAIDVFCDYVPPSPRAVERLFVALETGGEARTMQALLRIGKADPALAKTIEERIAQLLVTRAYPKSIPAARLEELARKLAKGAER